MGIAEILLSIALLFSGIVLFLVVRMVLEQMGIFQGRRGGVMSLSIACLIVPIIAMFLLVPGGASENGHSYLSVNFELLPGFAVSGIIILFLSFTITAVIKPVRANEVPTGESAHKPVKPKLPSRPKKQPESPPAPQKPGGKRKNEAKTSTGAEEAETT